MDRSRFFDLRDRLQQLRGRSVDRNGRQIPVGILMLEEELLREPAGPERYDLYLLMRGEYFEAGLRDLEVDTARRCVTDMPDEPLPWISLAEALRTASTLQEAKNAASTAVTKAFAKNRLVRYALTTQARIAAESGDAEVLNEAISRLVQDAPNVRVEDAPLSLDFLGGISSKLLNRGVTEEYVAIVRANSQNSRSRDG
jgi:hypothetical protein